MIRAVLFDLDGTLLDSAPDLVASLNHLRVQEGFDPLPLASIQSAASRGALGLLQAGMPPTDAETLEARRLAFLAHYEQFSFVNSSLYAGIPELLAFLRDNRTPWGIVTNKPEYLTVPVLSAAGLDDAVGCCVCGDTIAQRKPHPAPVLLACERLGVSPRETVFVGDDVRDLEAGIAAGVITCGALYGYGSGDFLKAEHALLVSRGFTIDSPADLQHWLRDHFEAHQSGGQGDGDRID